MGGFRLGAAAVATGKPHLQLGRRKLFSPARGRSRLRFAGMRWRAGYIINGVDEILNQRTPVNEFQTRHRTSGGWQNLFAQIPAPPADRTSN